MGNYKQARGLLIRKRQWSWFVFCGSIKANSVALVIKLTCKYFCSAFYKYSRGGFCDLQGNTYWRFLGFNNWYCNAVKSESLLLCIWQKTSFHCWDTWKRKFQVWPTGIPDQTLDRAKTAPPKRHVYARSRAQTSPDPFGNVKGEVQEARLPMKHNCNCN